MSDEKFDAIIVGGGLAGCSAAIVLANAGLAVLLVERGDFCGAKNMTGGRLYGHSLEKIIPDFAKEAPIERRITKEKVSLMSKDGSLDIGFGSKKLSSTKENASYTVLRAQFDQWLAQKAEEAGAEIIPGILVDELIVEDGKVVGIYATGEELYADVVVLADGVNSLLAQSLGMKKELEPHQVAVGAKEVIRLGEDVINQRFGIRNDEGVSWLSCGDPTIGGFGGGLLYTNKDSVSIGIVATLSDIDHSGLSINQLLDRFKEHPSIAPYIEGGTPIEYSGHLVPEEGIHMVPELYRDGVLVTGDAAGFCINLGFTVRGMDFAIESGRLAAETIIKAHEIGDFSAETLSAYEKALRHSFVFEDMEQYKGFPTLLGQREIFEDLPEMANDIAAKAFTVDGNPQNLLMYIIQSIAQHTTAAKLSNFVTKVLEAF
ncbi:Electron transfer flavoprotein-ubiquinone oxidoreductase [Fusobacterium sp. DD29]|uniref:FAD-dependent oxidoreductase n=1 Tax=unclassified Fusobacterium TaxID=2648384 RepID=UPI001B8D1C43|nr:MULTISPECIES: FAD-dependent oxidoreductase [unclassified Fusobacterium]MBR8701099.1 Electron transfer flavoprotein-ubiquinone oxidoreductase [Fusobacterium sp. DD45]MBR8710905.1 Electron transfer flavoprotein-ubiquinone oxidoreductase [Fusobacterium sp. DD28]MBR8748532.1 Electron transfer flavoprotein-ubiquinone oxidoreductase [Fusobacterium sp. DD29]MBR8751481.1 Electron transfer flavoprotein-ubiquinone oxidoreductase [Fusobacterium sp. DD26]MBR8760799.1 Electron transfer flavoprotein-ubiq